MIPNLRNHTPHPIPKQESSPNLVTDSGPSSPSPFSDVSQSTILLPGGSPEQWASWSTLQNKEKQKQNGTLSAPPKKTKFPKIKWCTQARETQLQVGLTAASYRAQISGFFNVQGCHFPSPGPTETPQRTPPPSLPACPCKLHVGLEASLPVAWAPGERVSRWAPQETTARGANPSLTAFSILPSRLGSFPPKWGAGRKSLGPPLPSSDTFPP